MSESPRAALKALNLSNLWHLSAVGFGSGLAPKAPGTFGTVAAILPYFLIAQLSTPWYLLVLALTTWFGIVCCQKATDAMGVHDHGAIVWDEFVGFWITMLWVPFSWTNLLLGFVLFRFFDVLKPWPIKAIDKKVDGGLGIMLDDVLAGVFACASLHLILHLLG
ncbi:phosphatidylglycerophosphatase A family protein [Aliagarivorans marinus]|uniref:phosphatidylglycerophosphatase A family protein n=1 Tax=Aliagarivorans marinus TaxID=561965 RepID=UPI00040E96F9|nr:phosphatidylglycerophosphatase A [Aliagarivorans marinus]